MFYPPKYIFNTNPTPKAMDNAEKMASIALDKPETKSPDMVSLMALVIATPGTKGIIDAIITVFILSAMPITVISMDKKVAIIAPIKLFMKKVSLYLFILLTTSTTKKPTNILDIKSSILPPNNMDKKPQDKAPNRLLKSGEYVSVLSIILNFFMPPSIDILVLTNSLLKSFTRFILFKLILMAFILIK